MDFQEDLEDEAQPWENVQSAVLKRGQKDFEPDDTALQRDALQRSLDSMFTALGTPRPATTKQTIKAYYENGEWRCELKGNFMQTMGVVKGLWCYLTNEEIVYLVERGTVEPFLVTGGGTVKMDLQGVYTLSVDAIVEYQVYANLKRCGYIVLRHREWDTRVVTPFQPWLMMKKMISGILNRFSFCFRAFTPWWLRSKFTSYRQIFRSLQLQPTQTRRIPQTKPLKITFDVWKPNPRFPKREPPPPDFQIITFDISARPSFPTYTQLSQIFSQLASPTAERKPTQRMKDGYENVIFALVNDGVINYMRVSKGMLFKEDVIPQADTYRRTKR